MRSPPGWRGAGAPIRSNYLDLTQIDRYWSPERLNHHTAPTTMVYGLREALGIVLEEGLDARIARHRAAGAAMAAGLAGPGSRALRPAAGPRQDADAGPRPRSPDGVDDAAFRSRLLEAHGVEIMGAFGPLAGRIWRIGTMAGNARPAPVARTLGRLAERPGSARHAGTLPDALAAADRHFDGLARAAAPA